MSIVPMQRVTLCGLAQDKVATLDRLQALGVLHPIPLRTPGPLEIKDPEKRHRAESAFRHIAASPAQMRPYRPDTPCDADEVVGQILANRARLRELSDRRDELRMRVRELAPWGEFTFPPLDELAGYRIWLYALPVRERHALDKLELPWQIVGHAPTVLHVAVMSRTEPPDDLLPVKRTLAGSTPLSQQRAELEDIEIAIEKAEAEWEALTRWRLVLGANLAAVQDRDELRTVGEQTLDQDIVFAVQGWAPVDATAGLEALATERGLALLTEPPHPHETPPTLLRGETASSEIGGMLTSFYTSPGYRNWDPGLIVFVSFAIFFAMILADAGYALLIGAVTALYWRKMGASEDGRKFRTMVAGISAASLAYGVAAGSYFGIALPPGSFLASLKIIDVTDFSKMMKVSVVIGALHIALALAIVTWLNRGTGKSIASLGWILAIAGGLTLGFELASRGTGIGLLAAGLLAVVIGGATQRPVTQPIDWLWRISDGLLSLTGVTKLFGDILSYLRLFALGLASASLAVTFNQMALSVKATHPGLGVLFAILIILLGHGINLVIGLMSAVVHGLRLNYIEFFGWGLTEEGYPFRAFAKRKEPR
jgi:V/A-type H+-transporting ATPase subunit I